MIKKIKKKCRILEIQKRIMPEYKGQVFTYGNSKLPKSTLIVNLSSAENCPSRKRGLCEIEDKCYARKCERIYPNYKKKNLIVEGWFNSASDEDIIDNGRLFTSVSNASARAVAIFTAEYTS